MKKRSREALDSAKKLADQVQEMVEKADDLDLQRLLKQIEADLMDIQHKLAIAVRLVEKG
jgi:uncharacterized Zn finger protein